MNGKTLAFFNEYPLITFYARWHVDMGDVVSWTSEDQSMQRPSGRKERL